MARLLAAKDLGRAGLQAGATLGARVRGQLPCRGEDPCRRDARLEWAAPLAGDTMECGPGHVGPVCHVPETLTRHGHFDPPESMRCRVPAPVRLTARARVAR